MYDICCVGHITLDKVITTKTVVHMPGGTSFYFSNAIRNMDLAYCLVTAVAARELPIISALRAKGIEIKLLPSEHTVYFENSYPENKDHRTQRVLQKADPFHAGQLTGIDAKIFHLGPLLADDMPAAMIQGLAARGMVSLDVQGYLREVCGEQVCAIDWQDKNEALEHITFLKANESEMAVITGETNIRKGAKMLGNWGVKEVLITLGSMGSVIYADGRFYDIPAYTPMAVVDTTGCGDTYMAGYLSQRVKGRSIQESAEFGAAMATLKIELSGPFTGTSEEVTALVKEETRKVFFQESALPI